MATSEETYDVVWPKSPMGVKARRAARTNAYAFSNDGPNGDWTAKAIDRSTSLDITCQVPDE